MQGSKRDAQRSSKRYVTPINKRMHCILICFTWQVLVHMFSSEYVYVVVFIQQKDSKRRLCEVSARICTRYAQRHQLAKAISKALACEVVAAKTSATHTHIRALSSANKKLSSHRVSTTACACNPRAKPAPAIHMSNREGMWCKIEIGIDEHVPAMKCMAKETHYT